MIISDLQVRSSDECFRVSVTIEWAKDGVDTLWFSVPKEYGEFVTKNRYDAFLVGLLYPAMKTGENIYVRGALSSKLCFNIQHYVIPLLCSFSLDCKPITVFPDELSSESQGGTHVGTGFSGGVDSFCTIFDHYETETNKDYRIDSLLFLNVGSHGASEEVAVRNKFLARYEYLRRFPASIGLPFVPVDSNLYMFHADGHQRTHTLTSGAGILFLQGMFTKYYYSSPGLNYQRFIDSASYFRGTSIGLYCDPILLPLLSTESTELISDGHRYTRVEKVMRIVDYEPVRRFLNVCVGSSTSYENCSVCSKCCRTMLTLEGIGRIDEFASVFDIDAYRSVARQKYICSQLLTMSNDYMASDNINLMKASGVRLPSRCLCIAYSFPQVAKSFMVRIASLLPRWLKQAIKRMIGKA